MYKLHVKKDDDKADKENEEDKKEEEHKEEKEKEGNEEDEKKHVTEGQTWLADVNAVAHFESLNWEVDDTVCY